MVAALLRPTMTTNRRSRGRKSALKTAAVSMLGVAAYSLFSEESILQNGRRSLTSQLEHEMELQQQAAPLSMPAQIAAAAADDAEDADFNDGENMSYLISSHSTLLPWAEHNLVDIHEGPAQTDATSMFWHIPKAGGTTAKQLYQW